MERSHDQVTGLGQTQHQLDGFEVPHLTDHDHVGRLAEHAVQGLGK
jgi:hypothetical protein